MQDHVQFSNFGLERSTQEAYVVALFEDFTREKLSVRYVTMNDSSRQMREDWMMSTFRTYDEYEFVENDTRFFSSVNAAYDVLVIGGNDPARLGSIIRANRPVLASKIKICLMSRSNSHKRARVLTHGFDDAIDITRVSPAEALARILAIRRRQQISLEETERLRDFQTRLGKVCRLDDLTPRQRQAIEILFRNKGRIISYQTMIDEIGGFRREITAANLKVIICKLRKNLIGGARVLSVPRSGYQLVTEGAAPVG